MKWKLDGNFEMVDMLKNFVILHNEKLKCKHQIINVTINLELIL